MKRQTSMMITIIIIFSIMSIVQLVPVTNADLSDENALQSHGPIVISNNLGFNILNGVSSEIGTKDDPYIIENWKITVDKETVIYIVRGSMKYDNKFRPYISLRFCIVSHLR